MKLNRRKKRPPYYFYREVFFPYLLFETTTFSFLKRLIRRLQDVLRFLSLFH